MKQGNVKNFPYGSFLAIFGKMLRFVFVTAPFPTKQLAALKNYYKNLALIFPVAPVGNSNMDYDETALDISVHVHECGAC